MHHDPGLVTGDAVVLELPLARSASRALAFGVDVLVQLVCFLLLVLALGAMPLSPQLSLTLLTTGQLVVIIGYFTMLEGLSRGRTVGKMLLGLRAVRQDGGPIQLRHAFIRALTGVFVDFGPFGIWGLVGFLVSLVSRTGRRVGDFLAGTVVIRYRAPKSSASMVAMPPELAHWAAQLDLTTLPDTLALAIRQYLGRHDQLNPSAQERVGRELAADVARYTGAAVPSHVPARTYLSAVLAERQSRSSARLTHPAPGGGAASRERHSSGDPQQPSGTPPPEPDRSFRQSDRQSDTHPPSSGERSGAQPEPWTALENEGDSFTPPA